MLSHSPQLVSSLLIALLAFFTTSSGDPTPKKVQIHVPRTIQHHHHTHTKLHVITVPIRVNSTNTTTTPAPNVIALMPVLPINNATLQPGVRVLMPQQPAGGMVPMQPTPFVPGQPNFVNGGNGFQQPNFGGVNGMQQPNFGGQNGMQPNFGGGQNGMQPNFGGGQNGMQPNFGGGQNGMQNFGNQNGGQQPNSGGGIRNQQNFGGGFQNRRPNFGNGQTNSNFQQDEFDDFRRTGFANQRVEDDASQWFPVVQPYNSVINATHSRRDNDLADNTLQAKVSRIDPSPAPTLYKTVINVHETKSIPLTELLNIHVNKLFQKDFTLPRWMKSETFPEKTAHVKHLTKKPEWVLEQPIYSGQYGNHLESSSQQIPRIVINENSNYRSFNPTTYQAQETVAPLPHWVKVKDFLQHRINEDFPDLKLKTELMPRSSAAVKVPFAPSRTDETALAATDLTHIGYLVIDDKNKHRFVSLGDSSNTK